MVAQGRREVDGPRLGMLAPQQMTAEEEVEGEGRRWGLSGGLMEEEVVGLLEGGDGEVNVVVEEVGQGVRGRGGGSGESSAGAGVGVFDLRAQVEGGEEGEGGGEGGVDAAGEGGEQDIGLLRHHLSPEMGRWEGLRRRQGEGKVRESPQYQHLHCQVHLPPLIAQLLSHRQGLGHLQVEGQGRRGGGKVGGESEEDEVELMGGEGGGWVSVEVEGAGDVRSVVVVDEGGEEGRGGSGGRRGEEEVEVVGVGGREREWGWMGVDGVEGEDHVRHRDRCFPLQPHAEGGGRRGDDRGRGRREGEWGRGGPALSG